MTVLEKQFPSLTLFSDLNWVEVSREYDKVKDKISFPEYLQIKSEDDDCPDHLVELAFYEMAKHSAQSPEHLFPRTKGVHLNPTAHFLSLEFDIEKMLEDAATGKIKIQERRHILCLYRNKKDELQSVELHQEALEILEYLEDGPQKDLSFLKEQDHKEFLNLVNLGLVFNITNP